MVVAKDEESSAESGNEPDSAFAERRLTNTVMSMMVVNTSPSAGSSMENIRYVE